MVEGARLERGCAVTRTEGSNPSLSAIKNHNRKVVVFCFAQKGFEPVRVLALRKQYGILLLAKRA